MKTDIEIAQEAVMEPIERVAEKLEIGADDLELYGKYKAKLSEEFMSSVQDRPERPPPASVWERRSESLGKRRSSPSESLPLGPALASRAVRPAAAMHRWFPWRI